MSPWEQLKKWQTSTASAGVLACQWGIETCKSGAKNPQNAALCRLHGRSAKSNLTIAPTFITSNKLKCLQINCRITPSAMAEIHLPLTI